MLVVFYGNVLQEQELLQGVYSSYSCTTLRYSTAAVKISKLCVQFLLIVLFYVTVLQE